MLSAWDSWTQELNELLTLITRLVSLENEQDNLLQAIVEGPLLTTADLAPAARRDGCHDPRSCDDRGPSRFQVTGDHLLRRGFIKAVGLGLEEGSFPGLLVRLFLHRVTGEDHTRGAVENGDGRHSQQRPCNAGDDAAR